MIRREFLKTATLAGVGAMALPADSQLHPVAQGAVVRPASPEMIYRELGRTGEKVSLIGVGGANVAHMGEVADSTAFMRAAIESGVTFFDNGWDYSNGLAEERMGAALRDGYRQKVFLMTKIDSQSAVGFASQLETSLKRLQTDTLDLVQFHEVIRMGDPEAIFAPGGSLEGALAAKKAGKLRYIGFTGHKDPAIHLHMLEVADKHGFHFDTLQMPINIMDAHYRSFGNEVLPVANRKGIGVLAMKTFGAGAIARANIASPIEMLHYSMTLPVSVVITGMDNMAMLHDALTAARTFKPLQPEQIASLLARSKDLAADGSLERFKTGSGFDQTSRNPQLLA